MYRQTLFEINTRIWLKQLSEKLQLELNLGSIPDQVWLEIKSQGFDWVWLMGIWKPSKISQEIAKNAKFLKQVQKNYFPGESQNHIKSSPYAIADYSPNSQLGNFNDLYKLHHQLNRLGLQLVLDFVPNHTALDHRWIKDHPEYYLQIPDDEKSQTSYQPADTNNHIAYGKDPFFEPWTDTAQLNYANQTTRNAMQKILQKISNYCDGVRCDMAMLVTNKIFKKTWQNVLSKDTQIIPDNEFWQSALKSVKSIKPEFIFIAEVYWQMESELWDQGFDFCYDKTLYDHFEHRNSQEIFNYIKLLGKNINKLVHFSENHDEPRALTVFSKNTLAVTTFNYVLPGLNLIYQGQELGKKLKIPVQLNNSPEEKPDLFTAMYFKKLFDLDKQQLFTGDWQMLTSQHINDNSEHGLIACRWQNSHNLTVIVVNIAIKTSQGHIKMQVPQRGTSTFTDLIDLRSYKYQNSDINQYGLYVDLKPGQIHIFKVIHK